MVNRPSPSWCNCHLDTQPRHCRVCAPERKPTRKRALGGALLVPVLLRSVLRRSPAGDRQALHRATARRGFLPALKDGVSAPESRMTRQKATTLGKVIDRARHLRQQTEERIHALIAELDEEDRGHAREVLDVDVTMPEGE